MQKFIASMVLAFVATFVAACGGDTTVTNNFGDLSFTGGNTSVNDNDTITTITGTTTPAPAPVATTTVATTVEDGQMSYKYDIEVRLNDSSLSPFQNGQVERGWANIALTDGQIEPSWLDDEYALIEISVVESSTNVLVTPTLWLGQGMVPQNVQFDDTRVASWNFGEQGYDIPEDGLGFSIQARVSETVPNGIYFVNIRSLVVKSKRDGRLVRMNTDFLTVYRQFQVVDQWNATMCRDGFSYCGTDTQWNGAACVSSVTQIPGETHCLAGTRWDAGLRGCVANAIPSPPPPTPTCPGPVTVYAQPANDGNSVQPGNMFSIRERIVGCLPSGSYVAVQVRLSDFTVFGAAPTADLYINGQYQHGINPLALGNDVIIYTGHTLVTASNELEIRLDITTHVAMPAGIRPVEFLSTEVTLPDQSFWPVTLHGTRSILSVEY